MLLRERRLVAPKLALSVTTKHCLQTHDAHPRIGSKDAPHPTTTFGCVARVLKEQGWLALWRGNLANVLKKVLTALVSGCIIRITFQAFRHVVPLNQGSVREGLAQQLVAHGIAAIAWTALLYPFEYIHTRMAVGTTPATSLAVLDLRCLLSLVGLPPSNTVQSWKHHPRHTCALNSVTATSTRKRPLALRSVYVRKVRSSLR